MDYIFLEWNGMYTIGVLELRYWEWFVWGVFERVLCRLDNTKRLIEKTKHGYFIEWSWKWPLMMLQSGSQNHLTEVYWLQCARPQYRGSWWILASTTHLIVYYASVAQFILDIYDFHTFGCMIILNSSIYLHWYRRINCCTHMKVVFISSSTKPYCFRCRWLEQVISCSSLEKQQIFSSS